MSRMSIREFNANVSAAFARVEAGEALVITRNGRAIAQVQPGGTAGAVDPDRKVAREQLGALMRKGVRFGRPLSYQDRTE